MAAKSKSDQKKVNMALQGGGAHGAFTWGVLDRLLEDERIDIEAITAASAGAMNAAVLASGMVSGGREGAREALQAFWYKVGTAASMLPIRPTMMDKMMPGGNLSFSPAFFALDFMTRVLSPYQFNFFDINPLRSIVEEVVDFEAIRANKEIQLFINATNARTGKIKVFNSHELTLDMVMASACLPFIFKTVEIGGEAYWDGGYSGNPALYPLFYSCTTSDVIIVQINPIHSEDVPTQAAEIFDRVNEISFNATLMREIRAIDFVSKLLKEHRVPEGRYKDMKIHLIQAEDILHGLGRASKLNADWDFLQYLRDVGRQAAHDWIEKHYDKVGRESSVNIGETYL